MVIFHSYVSVPEGISYIFLLDLLESLKKNYSRIVDLISWWTSREIEKATPRAEPMIQQVIPGNLEDFQF